MWKVEYDNDTGPNDEGFCEWWTITNGEKTFTTHSKPNATWLCHLLNSIAELREKVNGGA